MNWRRWINPDPHLSPSRLEGHFQPAINRKGLQGREHARIRIDNRLRQRHAILIEISAIDAKFAIKKIIHLTKDLSRLGQLIRGLQSRHPIGWQLSILIGIITIIILAGDCTNSGAKLPLCAQSIIS